MSDNQTPDFDPSIAEDAIDDYFISRGSNGYATFDSSTPGVVAFERISENLAWDELAAHVVRKTGYTLTCIADADWSFNDQPDEEATWFAFETEGLTDDYRDDPYRNKLQRPFTPETAPTAEDFARRNQALKFVVAHRDELAARLRYIGNSGDEYEDTVRRSSFLNRITADLDASQQDVIQALLDRDVDKAMELHDALEASTDTPKP